MPSAFPQEEEHGRFSYQYWPLSAGGDSRRWRWAEGPAPDGKGRFEYVEDPQPQTGEPVPPKSSPELFNTGRGGLVQQGIDKVRDTLG